MAKEDFRTATETDPNANITVAEFHIDHDSYENEDAHVQWDKGAAHFGDFEHLIDIRLISSSDQRTGSVTWMLSNAVDDEIGLRDANETHICILFYQDSGSNLEMHMLERFGAGNYTDQYDSVAFNTWYYLTLAKSGTGMTCKIYSDAIRSTLVDTLTLTLQADHTLRYVFPSCTANDGDNFHNDQDIANLDLQEAVGVSVPVMMHHYNRINKIIRG